jgi:hypothetical protein
MKTLKEKHDQKKLVELKNKISKFDVIALHESKQSSVILEAIDDQDLKLASEVITKLRTVKSKFPKITSLVKAIETMESEINKYTAGGVLTNAINAINKKLGRENPIVKSMTFANALEMGFSQLPTIVKNNIENAEQNKDKKIAEVLQDEKKKNVFLKNVMNAISPKGIFGIFAKNIPYLNKEMLVKELMTAVTIGELSQVTTLITSGAQAQNIAKDLESTMKSGETGTTKPSDPAETTKKTSQTTATTTPTAAEKQSPGSESPAAKAPPKEQTTKNRMKKAQMALAKLNNAEEVMSILQKAGVFN